MKTSIKIIAIVASLTASSVFADGYYNVPVINLGAGAIAGTYAAGSVSQDHHTGNYVSSGAVVETGAGASVSYSRRTSTVEAGAASATEGFAGGNGSAGYLGASGAFGTISVAPGYRD